MSDLPPARTLGILAVLTLVSGFLDAVSYIGLGHVFTANMTGNVVILGFAAAGAPGFSASASATALAAFLAGAVVGGRMAVRWNEDRRRWLAVMLLVEAAGTGVAAMLAHLLGWSGGSLGKYLVIVALALTMGCRNATVRRLAVPDMTTTVLTLTLTGLAADSTPAGGTNPRLPRRLLSIALMLTGAFTGARLLATAGVTVCLTTAAAAVAVTLAVCVLGSPGGELTPPEAGRG